MSPWRQDRKRWIEQGIAAYRQSLQLNPYDSFTFFDLGMADIAAGEISEAQAAFLSGLKVDPNDPAFYVALGAVYASQGKLGEARTVFERALALSSYEQDTIRHQLQIIEQAAAHPSQ